MAVPPPPVLMRQISEMETRQGTQLTCYAHVSARIMVRNIFEMPNETAHWDKDCNRVDGYNKICIFLYFYFVALHFNFSKDKPGVPLRILTKCNDVLRGIRRNRVFIPDEFNYPQHEDIKKTTLEYFDSHPLNKSMSVNSFDIYPYDPLVEEYQTPLANLILLFLQMNYYIGFLFLLYGKPVAHIITIIGYNSHTQQFVCKDSAGGLSYLYVEQLGKEGIFDYHRTKNIEYDRMQFFFAGKYSPMTTLNKKAVLKIAKEFKADFHYYDENPFSKKEILQDILLEKEKEKEKEPAPEVVCKKNKECPIPCSRVTRYRPRTTAYCRKRRTKKVNLSSS